MNKLPDIATLLPHESPMILIDKLVDVVGLTIHCQVCINANGMFFDKEINGVPAWVGIEFMAQTVAAWSGYQCLLEGNSSPIGFLLGSRRYNCECDVFKQHQLLDIYAEQLMESDGMTAFLCRIECDGKEIVTSQLNAFVPSPKELDKMLKKEINE